VPPEALCSNLVGAQKHLLLSVDRFWFGRGAVGIFFIIVIGSVNGLIKSYYEYNAEENNEISHFQFGHFVFFSGSSLTGEIQCKSEDENSNTLEGLNRYYFSGSYSNNGINAKIDSVGTV